MKKLFIFIFILSTSTVFAQKDGSETFNGLRDAITPSIPEGFSINTERTIDNRFSYSLAYDKDGSELNSVIYSLYPNAKGFSEMDIALGSESFTWKDRKALFTDGSQTGMSGIELILKNNAGKFSVSHKVFQPSEAITKKDLEQILAKISFDKLEDLGSE